MARFSSTTSSSQPARPRPLNRLRRLFTRPLSPLDQARALLTAGSAIGAFPEGTANRDPQRLLAGRLGTARLSLETGVPIFTHLAVDVEPAIEIFREEGLPLDRVLFGHADDGVSQGKVRDRWIAEQGGRIGFDTFGYDLELPDPPFWGRPRQERLDHFLGYLRDGLVESVLASADANCSPLGWPGVKGHTVNYLFEVLIPALREAGVDEATITRVGGEVHALCARHPVYPPDLMG